MKENKPKSRALDSRINDSTIKSVNRHLAKKSKINKNLRKENQSWYSAFKKGKKLPDR